nr:methyl-accepting chemotaxis protein [uncultured Halomonas sp.]
MNLSNLNVGTRLYTGFGILIALLVALQISSYLNFSKLGTSIDWNTHTYEVISEVDGILTSLINIETGQRGFSLTGKESSLEPLREGLESFGKLLEHATSLTSDNPAQQERFAQLAENMQQWLAVAINPSIDMRRAVEEGNESMQNVVAMEQAGKGKQAMDAMRDLLLDIRNAEASLLVQRSADMEDQQAWTQLTTIAGIVLGLVIGVIMAIWITRSIMKSLGCEPAYAANLANTIASGDLTTPISVSKNDKTSLLAAMRDMQDGLTKTVSTVRSSSGSIHIGSREIASGNTDLSSRTEEQAAALQQTAASMEELTTTVKQNADNARQGSTLAKEASSTATRGGEVVGEVITTMQGITASSKQVTDIISVIDSIAFQTNILALNASVEAARAGEQGRGFAVVASEVRNLASRSADAAKEIKALIEASATQINQGSALVESAGGTMRDIVESVRRVTDIMDEISSASQEQSSGIEQVNQAITQMDEVTQQNASLVEEAAAAASSLEEQAAQLETAVSIFRLSDGAANTNQIPVKANEPRVVPSSGSNKQKPAPEKQATEKQATEKRATAKSSELEWEEF